MRWSIDFGDRPWHRWFAWYPVRIDNERVWWEWVERRVDNCQGYLCPHYRWPESV